ncbi:TPA: hypothetical protein ACPJ1H_003938 [Vibrio alginolyticus]
MELFSRVQIVRESIATITQILADRDIPVSQEGLKAYVQYNEVTGEPVKVCLPYLPDDASEDLILSVQGFLDHEVGHLLFTDRKALLEIAHDRQLLEMQNIFEDPFVERKMRERFPGSRENLNRLYDFFIEKVIDKNYVSLIKKGEENPMAFFGILFPCIARAWAGFDQFSQYMNDKWELVQPIVDKIDDSLIEQVPFTNSTRENIEIGREVLFQIMKVDDDDDLDSPDDSDESSSTDRGSSGGSMSSKSGGGFSPIIDEEGDESDEPDKSEGSEDTELDPDSESDSDSDSESEDEEASGEKEVDGSSGDKHKEDKEDETPDESDTWKPSSGTDFLDHSIGDLDSSISGEIESMAYESAKRSDYLIPTTDNDVIEPAPYAVPEEVASRLVPKLDSNVADIANVIQSDFERAFVSQQRSHWRGNQTRGRINPSQLARLRTGDLRVFRKKEIHKTQDFDVQLVIDCSGSMMGPRIKLAIESAYAMGVALSRIGINFEIVGFTSRNGVSLGSDPIPGVRYARLDAIYMPVFKDFAEQWSPEVMKRLASWSDLRDYRYLRENIDGESLMMAAKRLASQRSPGKAMIVLSDGSPACTTQDHIALSRHLKLTTEKIERAGIHLVGIGIQHEGVANYFTNYSVLKKLDELPSEVISKVREIILG